MYSTSTLKWRRNKSKKKLISGISTWFGWVMGSFLCSAHSNKIETSCEILSLKYDIKISKNYVMATLSLTNFELFNNGVVMLVTDLLCSIVFDLLLLCFDLQTWPKFDTLYTLIDRSINYRACGTICTKQFVSISLGFEIWISWSVSLIILLGNRWISRWDDRLLPRYKSCSNQCTWRNFGSTWNQIIKW